MNDKPEPAKVELSVLIAMLTGISAAPDAPTAPLTIGADLARELVDLAERIEDPDLRLAVLQEVGSWLP